MKGRIIFGEESWVGPAQRMHLLDEHALSQDGLRNVDRVRLPRRVGADDLERSVKLNILGYLASW